MKSNRRFAAFMASRSVDSSTAEAPSASASAVLPAEVVITVTSAPSPTASFTPMWPSPPSPTTAMREPLPTLKRRRGDQVVMPAHRIGAARARSSRSGTFSTNSSRTTMWSE